MVRPPLWRRISVVWLSRTKVMPPSSTFKSSSLGSSRAMPMLGPPQPKPCTKRRTPLPSCSFQSKPLKASVAVAVMSIRFVSVTMIHLFCSLYGWPTRAWGRTNMSFTKGTKPSLCVLYRLIMKHKLENMQL